jgi:hypothetical protein
MLNHMSHSCFHENKANILGISIGFVLGSLVSSYKMKGKSLRNMSLVGWHRC